jgi:hypothetical protein
LQALSRPSPASICRFFSSCVARRGLPFWPPNSQSTRIDGAQQCHPLTSTLFVAVTRLLPAATGLLTSPGCRASICLQIRSLTRIVGTLTPLGVERFLAALSGAALEHSCSEVGGRRSSQRLHGSFPPSWQPPCRQTALSWLPGAAACRPALEAAASPALSHHPDSTPSLSCERLHLAAPPPPRRHA